MLFIGQCRGGWRKVNIDNFLFYIIRPVILTDY